MEFFEKTGYLVYIFKNYRWIENKISKGVNVESQ
jgi:hypothetical protein